jgi:N-methylhydantoinase B
MVIANVRVPEQVWGDLMAQVAANEMAARRLLNLMDEQGFDDLTDLATAIQAQSEAAMRRAIRAIPDGDYTSDVQPDGDGEELHIRLKLSVRGDEIIADYAGSSPQIDRAVNSVLNYTFAYTVYPIKCLTSPDLPNNEGSFRPITVKAPEGTVVNPRYPVAVGGRVLIGHFLAASVFQALAPVMPHAVQAPSGSPLWCLTMTGQHRGAGFTGVYFMNGGQGASQGRDGLSCLSYPSNVSNTPVEVMEALSPIRIERKAFRAGSGGAGQSRGGLGQNMEVRFLADHPVTVSFLADRLRHPAPGLLGGAPGARGDVRLNGEPINPKRQIVVQPGDCILLATPGGGGFGPPTERDTRAAERDVANGLVFPE